MQKMTDAQLRDAGWKWALRSGERLLAVTTDARDAGAWVAEGRGDVVVLAHAPAIPGGRVTSALGQGDSGDRRTRHEQ